MVCDGTLPSKTINVCLMDCISVSSGVLYRRRWFVLPFVCCLGIRSLTIWRATDRNTEAFYYSSLSSHSGTNFLIRTYAWILILRTEGLLNSLLGTVFPNLGPLELLNTPLAVQIGLVYGYLPFMILPLYAALEQLDMSLLEAAQDLGASPRHAFWHVTVPLSLPGILAGSMLVFIPTVGAFLTPDLLGGGKVSYIGNVIERQFKTARDWPFGSALSFMLMGIVLVGTVLYFRALQGSEESEAS